VCLTTQRELEDYENNEGGMSKEDTDNHLAWRFTGSVARVILAMLDPHQKNTNISNTLTRVFSGNSKYKL
jgi:hypothetical protein